MSITRRERPYSETSHQRRGEASQRVDSREIRARSFKIRNAWSQEERAKRAYTANIVQWLLVGPPVGFRLEAE